MLHVREDRQGAVAAAQKVDEVRALVAEVGMQAGEDLLQQHALAAAHQAGEDLLLQVLEMLQMRQARQDAVAAAHQAGEDPMPLQMMVDLVGSRRPAPRPA